jgi:hypothetical protein
VKIDSHFFKEVNYLVFLMDGNPATCKEHPQPIARRRSILLKGQVLMNTQNASVLQPSKLVALELQTNIPNRKSGRNKESRGTVKFYQPPGTSHKYHKQKHGVLGENDLANQDKMRHAGIYNVDVRDS